MPGFKTLLIALFFVTGILPCESIFIIPLFHFSSKVYTSQSFCVLNDIKINSTMYTISVLNIDYINYTKIILGKNCATSKNYCLKVQWLFHKHLHFPFYFELNNCILILMFICTCGRKESPISLMCAVFLSDSFVINLSSYYSTWECTE